MESSREEVKAFLSQSCKKSDKSKKSTETQHHGHSAILSSPWQATTSGCSANLDQFCKIKNIASSVLNWILLKTVNA
jgi:hypothetical protein